MRRILIIATGVLLVVGGVWLGTNAVRAWSETRSLGAEIAVQEEIIKESWEEARKIREEIEGEREDMKELPDSLSQGARAGLLMSKAFNIAKRQEIVERDRVRAQRRARYLRDRKEEADSELVRWGLTFALVEAFLVGGMIVVTRFPRRRRG